MAKHYALGELGVTGFNRLATLSNTPPPVSAFDQIEAHIGNEPALETSGPQAAIQGWSNIMTPGGMG